MALEVEIFWDEFENLVLRDVHEKMRTRVAEFMTENSYKENPIYKELGFHEYYINDWYTEFAKYVLRNDCSIVVLDKTTNEIHAVALLMWMTAEWRSWVDMLAYLPEYSNLADFIRFKADRVLNYAKENPNEIFDSLHIHDYFVHPDLRERTDFIEKFFTVICEVGRHMKMPRVTCVAERVIEQDHLRNVGFVELSSMLYSLQFDKNKFRPYAKLREIDEMNIILYAQPVEPLIPYQDMPIHEIAIRICSLDEEHQSDQGQTAANLAASASMDD